MSSVFKKSLSSVLTGLLVISASVTSLVSSAALATPVSPSFSGGSNVSGTVNTTINITDLQVTGVTDPTVDVHLHVSYGTLSFGAEDGLTFTGNHSGDSLYFSGSQADVNTDLATLQFTTSKVGTFTLDASMVGAGEAYNPANGHIYQIVQPDGAITWNDAKVAADASSAHGLTGYLATVTSADENSFIAAQLSGDGWIGASDSASEGDWKWVDGPETGTSFYTGNGQADGHVLDGHYANWNTGEPNDSSDNEDCGEFETGTDGHWNDLPCDGFTIDGYVVEYGSEGHLPAIPSKSLTITTAFPSGTHHVITTCAQLESIDDTTDTRYDHYTLGNDIDCSGIEEFVPIGADPAGWDDDTFSGVFDGLGHTISGIHIADPASGYYVGLFARTQFATLRNIKLQDGSIGGASAEVGSLVGEAYDTQISNVSSNMDVSGSDWGVGGIVGYGEITQNENATDVTFSNLSYTGTVASANAVGGLIGEYDSYDGHAFELTKSYFDGTVTGSSCCIGGLVGYAYSEAEQNDYEPATSLKIDNSYARGTISSGNSDPGGIVGAGSVYNDGYRNSVSILIDRVYSSAAITTDTWSGGGIIGAIDENLNDELESITVSNSFVAGSIDDSANYVYAITGNTGFADGSGTYSVDNVYFDQTATGLGDGDYLGNGTAVNTDGTEGNYFKNNHTNAPLDTWDFSTIWVQHVDDFPTFVADATTELTSAENSTPITLTQVGCSNITSTTTTKLSGLAVKDPAYTYPVGLVGFSLTGCDTGGVAVVTATFTGSFELTKVVIRKYNTTTHAYTTLTTDNSDLALTQTTLDGHPALQVVYRITDGGTLDQDGTANGTIVDPVGIGTNVVAAPNTGFGGLSL